MQHWWYFHSKCGPSRCLSVDDVVIIMFCYKPFCVCKYLMNFAIKDYTCMIFVHSWTTSGGPSDDCFSGRWLNWFSEGEVGWGFRYFFVPCPCSWTEYWMEYMQGAESFGCNDLLRAFQHVIAISFPSGISSFIFCYCCVLQLYFYSSWFVWIKSQSCNSYAYITTADHVMMIFYTTIQSTRFLQCKHDTLLSTDLFWKNINLCGKRIVIIAFMVLTITKVWLCERAANCPVKQMMLGKMPMGIAVHLSS